LKKKGEEPLRLNNNRGGLKIYLFLALSFSYRVCSHTARQKNRSEGGRKKGEGKKGGKASSRQIHSMCGNPVVTSDSAALANTINASAGEMWPEEEKKEKKKGKREKSPSSETATNVLSLCIFCLFDLRIAGWQQQTTFPGREKKKKKEERGTIHHDAPNHGC